MTEDQLQSKMWQEVWNRYPQLRRLMWAVPNSAVGRIDNKMDIIRANTFMATGLLPGVWDIHLYFNRQFYIIETKIGNNTLTVDKVVNGKKKYGQKEWGELMAQHGAIRCVYRTLEEGLLFIESILSGTACDFGL